MEPGIGKGMVAPTLESGFAFTIETSNDFQVIIGQTELLVQRIEQADFDTLTQLFIGMAVEAVAQVASGEAPKDMEEIPNLDDIGDASKGMTAVIGGAPPLRMDLVFFRRSRLGAGVWSLYFDGDTPVVSIGDAARKLDDRIIDLIPRD